jgi:hypothetical protein
MFNVAAAFYVSAFSWSTSRLSCAASNYLG